MQIKHNEIDVNNNQYALNVSVKPLQSNTTTIFQQFNYLVVNYFKKQLPLNC